MTAGYRRVQEGTGGYRREAGAGRVTAGYRRVDRHGDRVMNGFRVRMRDLVADGYGHQ